jgi:hypothetical protein
VTGGGSDWEVLGQCDIVIDYGLHTINVLDAKKKEEKEQALLSESYHDLPISNYSCAISSLLPIHSRHPHVDYIQVPRSQYGLDNIGPA